MMFVSFIMCGQMVKLFIFDMDGTIVRNRAFRYAYEKMLEVLGLDVSKDKFIDAFFDLYHELVGKNELKKAFDWDYVAKTVLGKMNIICGDVFSQLFLEGVEKGLVEIVRNAYYVLKKIKSEDNKIALLTNGYRKFQIPVLRKTKMLELFDLIFTADDLEYLKPHREAFLKVQLEAKISDTSKIYFVGDHIYFDIYGALISGLENIYWLTSHFDSGTYDVMEIADFMSRYVWRKYGISINLENMPRGKIKVINNLKEILQEI